MLCQYNGEFILIYAQRVLALSPPLRQTKSIDLYIYYYKEVSPHQLEDLASCMATSELIERDSMQQDRAQRFTIEKGYLRKALSERLEIAPGTIEIERTEKGKPALKQNSSLFFNISHCQDLFVIALAEGAEIGVDAERIKRSNNLERIALHYFSDHEIEFLMSDLQQFEFRFAWLWTQKESIGKLLGSGINKNLLKNATLIEQEKISPNNSWLKQSIASQTLYSESHIISVAQDDEKPIQVKISNNQEKIWQKL